MHGGCVMDVRGCMGRGTSWSVAGAARPTHPLAHAMPCTTPAHRALQYNDQKKLYLAMLGIMERGERSEAAEQLLRAATKKFGGSCKVWVRAIEGALAAGGEAGGEAARKLLQRGLAALPQRKHIKLISRAALAEFRGGDPERGRRCVRARLLCVSAPCITA